MMKRGNESNANIEKSTDRDEIEENCGVDK